MKQFHHACVKEFVRDDSGRLIPYEEYRKAHPLSEAEIARNRKYLLRTYGGDSSTRT